MAEYGDQHIYERDGFRCGYCGFDGRPFEHWMQLTIDHIRPRSAGGDDSDENKIVACYSCNTLSCRYAPEGLPSRAEMLAAKQSLIRSRRTMYHTLWMGSVAPRWLATPAPGGSASSA